MECSQSPSLSLCLHSSPPNPLFYRNNQFSKIKASARSPPKPQKDPTKFTHRRSPPPFFEKYAFPSPLPLHTKNPHAIYKDIQRFARQNKLKEALAILDYVNQQGIPVNPTTFSSLLAACVRSKSLADGKQIHVHIRTNGLKNNEFLRTKHAYIGTVISGKKRYLDVLSTYSEMRLLAVKLNVYTFSTVLKSFAGASAFRQGLKTHALLIKNGFINSSMLMTGLIDFYFKCGKIKLACRVFEEIPERDIVLWGAMIAGFAHNRIQKEALSYVRWMISAGIYPNSVIITTILPVIGEVWARKPGWEVHAYVVKSKQLVIQSGLVDMYCKCGDMDSCDLRVVKLGKEIHGQVLKKDFESIPFVAAEIVKIQAGFVDKACQLFKLMTCKYELKASGEHYSIIIELLNTFGRMIKLLNSCGCFEEAEGFVQMSSLS
ncbi:hypothetical protein QUC31_001315 [Theobroma cacao]|uniref:Pentatricopeptide repeat (PPR-like) superfamily protein, putative n=1 Tax=Theobroma cacao TaxID=3641 RepID=A0A061FIB2_THECC|nr:Pentatricopeptide repeat (PPR-like) superfamily protein, putative [Theobroma cacao]